LSAVVDTSVLIALAHLHLLRLLPQLFGEVYIPPAVIDEWSAGSTSSLQEAADLEQLMPGWFEVRSSQTSGAHFGLSLGPGESQAIALAMELDATYVILDDLQARILAEAHGVPVIGTIGVLLEARRRLIIASVLQLVESLLEVDFRLSEDVLNVIRREEEQGLP
jgi:predicted nucleic acid-binding protein